jgi:hypothetical protein
MMTMSEEDHEENPFAFFGDDLVETLTTERASTTSRCIAPRNWGIPTFREQMDGNRNVFELRRLDDSELYVQVELQHRQHSTGSDLWDSALVLAHALERPEFLLPAESQQQQQHTILELGSGTGALGLYCRKCLGHSVILTDLPENLSLIESNAKLNHLQDGVSILPLDWTKELAKELPTDYDLILGTDLCKFVVLQRTDAYRELFERIFLINGFCLLQSCRLLLNCWSPWPRPFGISCVALASRVAGRLCATKNGLIVRPFLRPPKPSV